LANRVLLGAVIGAHGIQGELKVKTFTESPENLAAYGPVETEDGRQFTIEALRPTKGDEAVLRFAGIAGRNAAETFKGERLYVPREALPPPEEGEFYVEDLIGLEVEDTEGKTLGKVIGLHNFGAGEMIEIETPAGEKSYIPFNDDCVPEVDIKAGRVVAAPPKFTDDREP
jgi:16S rRNA processing protein RimM